MKEVTRKLPSNASFRHYKGKGQVAHFYHANGFPLGMYDPLLKRLSEKYHLSALEYRAVWPDIGPPARDDGWQDHADDLIAFVEHHCQSPIIGIGHSMGASCTILAAAKRPDLFSKLVLIEPATISVGLCLLIRLLPNSILKNFVPIKTALKKRDRWNSRDSYLAYCKKFYGYNRFTEETLQAMARYGVIETDDGQVQLTFPKVWEAHNYTTPVNVLSSIKRLKIPCVVVCGKPSTFFTEAMRRDWQTLCPQTIFKETEAYGHLLPLENPDVCFDLINEGMSLVDRHS
jgi:pimeloyl-ACP methyl ester carboxylesterase